MLEYEGAAWSRAAFVVWVGLESNLLASHPTVRMVWGG
jgi:hypothetical protein